ncbi:TIGR03085 family metal-binding protein [Acidipropionibacterium timonense]|uniref:TIGR03085 family metal-binding protein n=1 Tax=Acidipropionibacterium timonense TaxID=2161818 RepID=UPI0010304611|nr:TIGR03085 family metal-binding protein [Acidipropionibacterium timonense]
MSLAQTERAALAADLDRLGPTAPTLCEGWLADDLLIHLLLRENDPLAVPGMAVEVFDEVTAARRRQLESRTTFAERVDRLRRGPAPWSVFRVPGLDRVANGAEFFVHHEDLLRAQPGWSAPRDLGRPTQTHLARILARSGRLLLRHSPVGVRVELIDQSGDLHLLGLRPGSRIVTLVGLPSEVLLHCFGRKEAARVEVLGEPDAVTDFLGTDCAV